MWRCFDFRTQTPIIPPQRDLDILRTFLEHGKQQRSAGIFQFRTKLGLCLRQRFPGEQIVTVIYSIKAECQIWIQVIQNRHTFAEITIQIINSADDSGVTDTAFDDPDSDRVVLAVVCRNFPVNIALVQEILNSGPDRGKLPEIAHGTHAAVYAPEVTTEEICPSFSNFFNSHDRTAIDFGQNFGGNIFHARTDQSHGKLVSPAETFFGHKRELTAFPRCRRTVNPQQGI